jgi:hypothetical protein
MKPAFNTGVDYVLNEVEYYLDPAPCKLNDWSHCFHPGPRIKAIFMLLALIIEEKGLQLCKFFIIRRERELWLAQGAEAQATFSAESST